MPSRPGWSVSVGQTGTIQPVRGLRGRRRRVAAIATAAVAFVGVASCSSMGADAASPMGADAAPPPASWQIVKQVHSGDVGDFTAAAAVGKTAAWAFDGVAKPTAWKRNGSSWTQVPFPNQAAGEEVIAAGATSPTDVWAFTLSAIWSRVLHWNGRTWTVEIQFRRQIGGAAVISPSDVWVFGQPFIPGSGLGAWHYNGKAWSQVPSGQGLEGGSALSADDVWAFDGASIAHWNGQTWSRTSLANLLPARQALNGPMLTGVYAESPTSVYAIGNGNLEDEGGPTVILHYNGHSWSKVAEGNYGYGTQPLQQISSDGHGGLWIPAPGVDGQPSSLLHYLSGKLTKVALPMSASKIDVESVALIPGTTDLLAGGFTHAASNQNANVVSVILQYGT